ncbi:hypothetical protein Pla52o_44310 [Novipirellula galeiformis]|uniref:Uncharacterized protein n=1 Tax=Novipirellula galeiformis TaxID=2528004 RepID=A0A5C6C7D6_9BACT|nr:hypothetical protein Pla52o_44310 [Novipirellula galeiformis]
MYRLFALIANQPLQKQFTGMSFRWINVEKHKREAELGHNKTSQTGANSVKPQRIQTTSPPSTQPSIARTHPM